MSLTEMRKYTYFAKYARHNKKERRRETWEEATDRVMQMHLRRYPQAAADIEWAFGLMRDQRVLGSQRALQFGGDPIERKHARMYNCVASFADRLRFFQECFWLLLCGSGTGFSVQRHHVAKLPRFSTPLTARAKKTYVVPDTIEGWADALGVLLSSYFQDPVFQEYHGCEVEFNFSLIREEGSPLSSASGKAPGPKPLMRALEKIKGLLDRCLADGQTRLRPIDAYDIVMHASDAVLSGGVRRSATICVFSPEDTEMMTAKTGNWFFDNPQRARSNNSVLLLRDKVTREQFSEIMKSVRQFGEPGFILADSTESIYNPCVEVNLYPVDEVTGLTGWQGCNLSTINGKLVRNKYEFLEAATAASIIGTLQAGYTDFPYLGEVSERIFRREALLGVSITGMMDSPDVLFNPEFQREAAGIVAFTNRRMAEMLGINPAARCTVVKPEGTTSCMLGTSSGIHPHHSRRYFRRIQANKMEHCFQLFAQHNPEAVEDSVWSANQTDGVMTFCVEIPEGAKTKEDIDAVTLLKYVRSTQMNWVEGGKEPRLCTQQWLSHNVSNTINVKPDEWEAVADYLYEYRRDFAAVSLLSMSGDKDYAQAPFCAVKTEEEMVKAYPGENCIPQAVALVSQSHRLFKDVWTACEAALGNVQTEYGSDQQVWVRTVEAFAEAQFGGSVREATYCLKDLWNLHTWNRLKESYRPVDYSKMVELEDFTKPMDTVACAGGSCDLAF